MPYQIPVQLRCMWHVLEGEEGKGGGEKWGEGEVKREGREVVDKGYYKNV